VPLQSHGYCQSDAGVAAVVEVIAAVVIDVDVVIGIPVFAPVSGLRIDQQK
jgi:hypothetical protein